MSYLGTKPSNSPLTSELIPNSIITNAKINDVAATKITGTLPDANAPSGSVLQVVSSTKTDTFSMTGDTYTTVTGLTASITPISAANKILIVVTMTCGISADATFTTRLARNGTGISIGDAAGSRTQATTGGYVGASGIVYQMLPQNMSFLDSPSTVSSITYAVQVRGETSGQTVYVNRASNDADAVTRSRFSSTITVMEIAA